MPTLSMPRYWQAVLLVWRGERPCFAVAMMKECDLPGPTSTNHLEKVEEGKSFESTEHWKTENIDSRYLFWLILIYTYSHSLYWIHSAIPLPQKLPHPNFTHAQNIPKHPTSPMRCGVFHQVVASNSSLSDRQLGRLAAWPQPFPASVFALRRLTFVKNSKGTRCRSESKACAGHEL